MTGINPGFRGMSKIAKTAFIVFIPVLAVPYLDGITKLASGSYIQNEKALFKLDSITLLAKAHFSSGGRFGGKSADFEDTEQYDFHIGSFVYNSIADINFIRDTLQYHGTRLTVYTKKDDYDKYINRLKDEKIEVYQIEIAGKPYVNLKDVNLKRKRELIFRICLFTLALIALGVSYWKLRQKESSI